MSDKTRRMRLGAALAGGAVLVTAVAGQAVMTSAADTAAVTATSGDLTAAGDVLPVSTRAQCDRVKNGTHAALPNHDIRMSVQVSSPVFDYHLFVMQDDGKIGHEQVKSAADLSAGEMLNFDLFGGDQLGRHVGWDYTAWVYTVNRDTGEYSAEWIGERLKQPTTYGLDCRGGRNGDTRVPSVYNRMAMAAPTVDQNELDETLSTSTETPDSTTEAPETSTPESSVTTTPEETTSTEPTTTPELSTTEPTTPSPTEDSKPVLVETVPNGAVTAGWTQGYTRVVVVDGNGAELAGGRVEEGSTLHWVNDELWILGPTENFRIMRGTDGDWRFYTDGGDVPRELRGN